jgi:hypothetical protein
MLVICFGVSRVPITISKYLPKTMPSHRRTWKQGVQITRKALLGANDRTLIEVISSEQNSVAHERLWLMPHTVTPAYVVVN